jgi:hypothetical protein
LTDNGFVFTTRHRGGANAFEIELLNRGVAQKNGTPNHPQTQVGCCGDFGQWI